MQKFLSWKNLVFMLLIGGGILGGITLSYPSIAKTISYQQMIKHPFIDALSSAENIGLGNLQRQPPQLTAQPTK